MAQEAGLIDLFDRELYDRKLTPQNYDLQTLVSGLQRFMVNSSQPGFRPAPGESYPAQKQIIELMNITKTLFLFWEPGAGKTGAAAERAEFLHRLASVSYVDGNMPATIRGTEIWVPNSLIKREIRKLLLCNHTGGIYMTQKIINAPTERQQRKDITMELGKWYRVYTYISVIDRLVKADKCIDQDGNILNLQRFIDECDNKNYFLDEIQVLQQDEGVGGVGRRKDVVFKILRNIRRYCKNVEFVLASGTPINKEVSEFMSFLDLLNDTEVPRTFLVRGRQMNITELASSDEYEEDLFQALLPYVHGRFSYMVSPVSIIDTKEMGEPLVINDVQTTLKIIPVYMSEEQTYLYAKQLYEDNPNSFGPISLTLPPPVLPLTVNNAGQPQFAAPAANVNSFGAAANFGANTGFVAPNANPGATTLTAGDETSAARRYQIEASIFTYPDSKYGKPTSVVGIEAYKEYIKDTVVPQAASEEGTGPKTETVKNIWSSPDLINYFRGGFDPSTKAGRFEIIRRIGRHSIIFQYSLMEWEGFSDLNRDYDPRDPANNKEFKVAPGCGLSFFVSVENGVAPYSICLQALGYELWDSKRSAFKAPGEPDILPEGTEPRPGNPCNRGGGERVLRGDVPAKRRFGVITSRTDETKNDSLRELQTSDVNVRGEYIRIIVISAMARAGINVFHIQQGHYMEGYWSPGVTEQAEGRIVRLNGFDALLRIWDINKRDPDDPNDDGKLRPKIFRFVARPLDVITLRQIVAEGGPSVAAAEAALRITQAYQGRDRVAAASGETLALPAVEELVYRIMYNRTMNNNRLYKVIQRTAIDAWLNRTVIEEKFRNVPSSSVKYQRFYPWKPAATTVEEGDYYLHNGKPEVEAEALRIADLLRSQAVDVEALVDTRHNTINPAVFQQSSKLLVPRSLNFLTAVTERILQADAPVSSVTEELGWRPLNVPHNNVNHMPFALNFARGELYQQPDLDAPDQLTQFYRDYTILNQFSTLQQVNADLGEPAGNVVTDLIKIEKDLRAAIPEAEVHTRLIPLLKQRLYALPQETQVQVVETIIIKALEEGWEPLPLGYKIILQAYNNTIFVFPKNEKLIAEISQQLGKPGIVPSEEAIYQRYVDWQAGVYGPLWDQANVPRIYSLITYLVTPQLRAVKPIVVVHMLYYVTQNRQQQFGIGTMYLHPFQNRRSKNRLRINDVTVQRWGNFTTLDRVIYQRQIEKTIEALLRLYEWRLPMLTYTSLPIIKPTIAVVAPDNTVRITSQETPSARDLKSIDSTLGAQIIRNVVPPTPGVLRMQDRLNREGNAPAADLRQAIWDALNPNHAFFIVRWGNERISFDGS